MFRRYKYFLIMGVLSIFSVDLLFAESSEKKSSLIDLPIQINQNAISNCFEKMKNVTTKQDALDLNSLRVTLERIYQLPKALLLIRHLEYKKESGKKIVYEFNAVQNSKPGAEIYQIKSYGLSSKGLPEDLVGGPSLQQPLTRNQLDKFIIDDELIKDERLEEYKMLNNRSISVKSLNFKVQEIESHYDNREVSKDVRSGSSRAKLDIGSEFKKHFRCSLFDGFQPLCQCL